MHRTQNPTAPAADTDNGPAVTPADILRGAANYLSRYGWIKHFYYGAPRAGEFPPACADGALGMAAYGYPCFIPHDNSADPGYQLYRSAADFLRDHLECTEKTLTLKLVFQDRATHEAVAVADLFAWNDRESQTAEHVTATLRAAADEYDWQHASEDDLETFAENELDNDRVPTREGFLAWLAARR